MNKMVEASQRELEEAMKKVKEAQSLISAAAAAGEWNGQLVYEVSHFSLTPQIIKGFYH